MIDLHALNNQEPLQQLFKAFEVIPPGELQDEWPGEKVELYFVWDLKLQASIENSCGMLVHKATLNERPFHEARLAKYSEDIMQVKLLILVGVRVDCGCDQSKVLPQEGWNIGL